MVKRCGWVTSDPLCVHYHDTEWGVPVHDDRLLFELLILEGAQAGLSWITILRKRAHYKKAFDNFDARIITEYDDQKVLQLLSDPGIVRNRQKIRAAIRNAGAFLAVQKEWGSFDGYIWQFTAGRPVINAWESAADIPVTTPEATHMSNSLKTRGFSFVGPTICYAFMQAVGMVNDHLTGCFRYQELCRK